MNKLISSTMIVGLLFAAASCGSDDKDSKTTVAETTVETTGESTVETVAAEGSLADQALAITLASVTAGGYTADEECLAAVIAQMSEADQQLIVDGGVGGSVTLSPEGEALSPAAEACLTAPVETTPGT